MSEENQTFNFEWLNLQSFGTLSVGLSTRQLKDHSRTLGKTQSHSELVLRWWGFALLLSSRACDLLNKTDFRLYIQVILAQEQANHIPSGEASAGVQCCEVLLWPQAGELRSKLTAQILF